jgi:hypothetical protein
LNYNKENKEGNSESKNISSKDSNEKYLHFEDGKNQASEK